MNIACPECSTVYRVDPDRVPEGGVTTRCTECHTSFRVNDAMVTEPGEFVTAPRVAAAETALAGTEGATAPGETDGPAEPTDEGTDRETAGTDVAEEPMAAETPSRDDAPVFGPQDPDTRARRLARALVSDIKVYHPEKWEAATEAGTLRGDFRDEILKSWEEYVEQVGEEMAKQTPYFRDALNEILARGERVF